MSAPIWTTVASASQTGGGYELIVEIRSTKGGPFPHIHRDRDEGFLVLEGRYRFVRGNEETEVSEGGFILVPRGTRHGFVTLVAPSRVLLVVSPPGLEGYFREMAARLADGASAPDAMRELAGRFDTHPAP